MYNRLVFGIASAPEGFQNIMTQLFHGLEGVEIVVDDLLVWSSTQEEHDERLKRVLQVARKKN